MHRVIYPDMGLKRVYLNPKAVVIIEVVYLLP